MTKWYLIPKLCQLKYFAFLSFKMGRKKQSNFRLLFLSHKKKTAEFTILPSMMALSVYRFTETVDGMTGDYIIIMIDC